MQNKPFPKVQSAQGYNNGSSGSQNSPNAILSPTEYDAANKHMKDRFIYALANSLGTKITVTTSSANKITGILQSISDVKDSIPSLILKYPTRAGHVYDDEFLMIPESSISMIACENLDFTPKASLSSASAAASVASVGSSSPSSSAHNHSTARRGFRIDTDISSNDVYKERERDLQKWVPEEDNSTSLGAALEEEKFSDANKWDQFKTNKDKFGIDAKFDENDYTVKLNVSNPKFKERMKFAETVSREILSQSSNGNLHIAEERGKLVDAENIDEEDKYSGVLRDNAESEKKLMNMLKTSNKPDASSKPPAPAAIAAAAAATAAATTTTVPSTKSSGQYIPPNQCNAQTQKDVSSTAGAKRLPQVPVTTMTPATTVPSAAAIPVRLPEKPATAQQSKDASKKSSNNEPAPSAKKSTTVPNKPAATPATSNLYAPSASSTTSTISATSATSIAFTATPASSTTQHVQKPQPQQQTTQTQQPSPQNANVPSKQKSPQLQKQSFTNHIPDQTQNQHQHQPHQQPHQQHQHQQPHQHQQGIPQQLPPQMQQQQPQHMMRNQQFGYQPRNNINQQQYGSPSMQYRNHHNGANHSSNQYNQNYANNNNVNANANQRMKKASPQFLFSHRPSDKAPKGSVLKDRFNILLSAKKEYTSNSINVTVDIIPMVPSFHTSPSWPETTSESYSEIFTKENNSHSSMHMQQSVYMHPQAYPQNHQQAYMGFQVQPPYYFPIVPSYPVYLPNVAFPMMGGNQGMDKVYPNHARHGNNY